MPDHPNPNPSSSSSTTAEADAEAERQRRILARRAAAADATRPTVRGVV